MRIALLAAIGLCLWAGPAKSHYPKQPKPGTVKQQHHRLHVLKGHAWKMVKHPTSYRSLVWHRKALHRINHRLALVHRELRAATDPRAAICMVFGPYCQQALAVSYCETGGTYSTNAQNGQYLGLFQMGSYARSRYGHSSAAVGQAQAAYRYFTDAGRDWSPWSCKP